MALPNVEDLKIHLNMTVDSHDEELVEILDAAIDLASSMVGNYADDEVTETHYGVSAAHLVLKRMPVGELTAIGPRAFPGVTTEFYDVADYVLDPETGILRAGNGAWFYGDYTVTYSVSSESTPAAVRLAILIIAAHLWETQRGIAPSPLAVQQGEDFGTTPGLGYAIPNRARDLLAAYVRPTIA